MDKTSHLSENATPDRRTQRTRQALSLALIALIQDKRYNAITVQDICDRANVGRSTFYAHYQDKDDLLTSNFRQAMESLGQPLAYRDGQLTFPIAPLFDHVKGHQHLYKALLCGGGMDVLMRAGQKQWSQQIEQFIGDLLADKHQPVVPIPVIAVYIAGSLQTLLLWWLQHKLPHSPERMDEMFQQLVMPGVKEILFA
jgi:AcrR family transcriptional regulator